MLVKTAPSVKSSREWFALLPNADGYLSYDVLCACERVCLGRSMALAIKNPIAWLMRVLKREGKCMVFSVWDDDELILLAPLCKVNSHKMTHAGDKQNLDYQDFIYNRECCAEKLQDAFDTLVEHLRKQNIKEIEIVQLAADSQTNAFMAKYAPKVTGQSKSVCIELNSSDYGAWFASLGKHVRQNVRTAYNRMLRDGHNFKHEFYSVSGLGADINSRLGVNILGRCRSVYRRRQENRYRHYRGLKHRLVLNYFNYTSLSVPGKSGFISVLYIDDQVAAFMEGYVSFSKDTLYIPRLAMDDQFSWYSPGLILVNETAKFLYNARTCDQSVKIDLSRGTEKYKLDMGGEIYTTRRVVFNTETIK